MNVIVAGVLPPFTLNIWQDISAMLQYDFMRQALLAGTILSVVAGLVGYFVVLRHQAFAGESLSDVAFTGALGGAALGFNPLASLLGTTIVVAVAMGGFGERLRGRDVAVGTVLAWVLGLGVLFLLHTMGFWFFSVERFWPVILIGIGAWQIARRQGMMGPSYGASAGVRGRSYVGPVVLLTLGTLFLIQSFDGPGFHRTWPLLLLVIGITKLWESHTSNPEGRDGMPPPPSGTGTDIVVSGEVQPPTEVNHG